MPRINSLEAEFKPRLYCVGTITEVKEPKETASGVYINQGFSVTGDGAAPNFNIMLLYRPEWFKPGFDPKTAFGDDKSITFVFGKNISRHGQVSILQGLAGSEEAAAELEDALTTLTPGEDGDPTISDITEVFNTFFSKTRQIGYVLKQRESDTGEVDDAGKKIKVRENGYEIDSLFYPTPEKLKALARSAAKSDGKSRATFEL